jgi:hypothetical protein
MTCRYYRTSSAVTALPMIRRWISDVPSKIVKLVEVRAVSAGRWPDGQGVVSTNSAPMHSLPAGEWLLERGRLLNVPYPHQSAFLYPDCSDIRCGYKQKVTTDSLFLLGVPN